MDLFVDADGGKPLAQQLYEQLRVAITGGRLLPGDQLTPSRQLAGELRVSRHTVTTAYGRLVAEGFSAPPAGADQANALRPGRRFAGLSVYSSPRPRNWRFDLRPGLPDPALFPAVAWRRRVSAAVAVEPRVYGHPAGKGELRRAIAGWVTRLRSVTATEDTVVVTGGAQHGIDLVARILLEPGDCVAVEDPGYP